MDLINQLAQIEDRLQSLIEGSAARLFPTGDRQTELANNLMVAMRSGIKTDRKGELVAPNQFTLIFHPRQAEWMRTQAAFIDTLTQTLENACQQAGLQLLSPLQIQIAEDEEISLQHLQVLAQITTDHLTKTTGVLVESHYSGMAVPGNAFLIVNGNDTYSLEAPVLNIGRRADNQIVIDDPRVSRLHAQLRAIKHRYMIFDLDSTGGTFVNDQRIHQAILYPGDVISLAGVPLIYGQDNSGLGETQELDAGSDY